MKTDAIEPENKWSIYLQIKDPKTGQNWVGLNRITNSDKGAYSLDLIPGEYKVELALPKGLNANLATDVTGTIVGR